MLLWIIITILFLFSICCILIYLSKKKLLKMLLISFSEIEKFLYSDMVDYEEEDKISDGLLNVFKLYSPDYELCLEQTFYFHATFTFKFFKIKREINGIDLNNMAKIIYNNEKLKNIFYKNFCTIMYLLSSIEDDLDYLLLPDPEENSQTEIENDLYKLFVKTHWKK